MMNKQGDFPPVEEVLDAYQSLQEDYAVAMARIKERDERIRELEAQRVPDVRCKCCGYLVTESEHKGCLRAADATAPKKEGE